MDLKTVLFMTLCSSIIWRSTLDIIVLVWSQYDGVNIEQWTIGYGWRQNQEAKHKCASQYIVLA